MASIAFNCSCVKPSGPTVSVLSSSFCHPSYTRPANQQRNVFSHSLHFWKRRDPGLLKGKGSCKSKAMLDDGSKNPDEDSQTIRIHYHREDGKYEHWGLHIWGDVDFVTSWEKPVSSIALDDFGVYWDVTMKRHGTLNFMLHSGDRKDCSGSLLGSLATTIWVVSGVDQIFHKKPDVRSFPKGSLSLSRAYWVKEDLLAWDCPTEDAKFFLHASKRANLYLSGKGVEGADAVIQLEKCFQQLPAKVVEKLPHLYNYILLQLPIDCNARELVKCQLAVASVDTSGIPLDATGVQLPSVLDELFAYDGPLGVEFSRDGVTLSLWAPTAQNIRLFLYSSSSGGAPIEQVDLEEKKGIWSIHGPTTWNGKYYLYEVTVFHPITQKIELSLASDPYSRGLSANGERSLIVDLTAEGLQPEGWKRLADEKPALKEFTDISIYELHIRDFSISDPRVDPPLRGTYLAFAAKESAGVAHLQMLADAGLTHVHLLPAFDFASVDERKENWKCIDHGKLATFPPDSEEQQEMIMRIQDDDGYNWGYDPVNWGVPEGSYATDPDGALRTIEFRTMVQALNRLGLRVIMDVVYNHLHASGPQDKYSVLDKIVPGYYLRRNEEGHIENSTCMNNTASEHYMVDRLIVDDLRSWAVNYKIDGFRFDLMGHLMKKTLVRAKHVLSGLIPEKDGVDGSKIYLYGEGWDFGEVARNGRGINAAQLNLAGTGIGSFNDRMRDAAIGGSPFANPLQQGFLTGLYLQPNALDQGDNNAMRNALEATTDWIHLGLVGNLREFQLTNCKGEMVKGIEVLTHDGVPVAYASVPEETINYLSAHDNETLFDNIMVKTAREVSLEDRCRINHMATSLVALSQGISFFHAGDELLRSKSLDRDSYNSGDWFNRLDFSYETNNWGVGLPPKQKNGSKWEMMRELLADASLKVTKHHIISAVENFKSMLKIRYSSPLFHLPTANDIQARLRFHNTGAASIPGVILMSIQDGDDGSSGPRQIDPLHRLAVVVFNACPTQVTIDAPNLQARNLSLHPIQVASSDEVVKTSNFNMATGTFKIPARTTAVFMEFRHG